MNRKKIIEDFETLRNLCLNIMIDAKLRCDDMMVISYRAHHDIADRSIVELGGESTKDIVDKIEDRWREIDKQRKYDG